MEVAHATSQLIHEYPRWEGAGINVSFCRVARQACFGIAMDAILGAPWYFPKASSSLMRRRNKRVGQRNGSMVAGYGRRSSLQRVGVAYLILSPIMSAANPSIINGDIAINLAPPPPRLSPPTPAIRRCVPGTPMLLLPSRVAPLVQNDRNGTMILHNIKECQVRMYFKLYHQSVRI